MRVPPHSLEAEKVLLGSVLLDNNVLERVEIEPDHFYKDSNKIIFTEIENMKNEGKTCDLVTVADWLQNKGRLDMVGGPVYLAQLTDIIPSVSTAKEYADIIRNKAFMRNIIKTSSKIIESCYREFDIDFLKDELEQAIFGMSNSKKYNLQSIQDITSDTINHIRKVANGDVEPGIKTGFYDLDEEIIGMSGGDFIILAGRPGMGKTALAMNIAMNVAEKYPVGIASLEMAKRKLSTRQISSLSGINNYHLQSGNLPKNAEKLFHVVTKKIENKKIYIDDRPSPNLNEIKSRARRMKSEKGIELLIVDYLQLVKSEGQSREREVSKISETLLGLAKELCIPVIALSQLNRGLETREDKRPRKSDLRDSGSIEQDADIIIFLYREEKYKPTEKNKNKAELIIDKNRNGIETTIDLIWDGETTTFKNNISMHRRTK